LKTQQTTLYECISPLLQNVTGDYVDILKKKHMFSSLFHGPYQILARRDRSITTGVGDIFPRLSYRLLDPVILVDKAILLL